MVGEITHSARSEVVSFAHSELHLPKTSLVVKSACKTQDTFNMGQEYKRYIL